MAPKPKYARRRHSKCGSFLTLKGPVGRGFFVCPVHGKVPTDEIVP